MFQKSFSEMHKKCFNETSVKFTTSETHKTQIKHVSNPTETCETKMKRMNRLKHGSWFAGLHLVQHVAFGAFKTCVTLGTRCCFLT